MKKSNLICYILRLAVSERNLSEELFFQRLEVVGVLLTNVRGLTSLLQKVHLQLSSEIDQNYLRRNTKYFQLAMDKHYPNLLRLCYPPVRTGKHLPPIRRMGTGYRDKGSLAPVEVALEIAIHCGHLLTQVIWEELGEPPAIKSRELDDQIAKIVSDNLLHKFDWFL